MHPVHHRQAAAHQPCLDSTLRAFIRWQRSKYPFPLQGAIGHTNKALVLVTACEIGVDVNRTWPIALAELKPSHKLTMKALRPALDDDNGKGEEF